MTRESSTGHSVLKQAVLRLEELQAKLDRLEGERSDPIAVVGMSCRFPGAPNVPAFSKLLHEGQDAITEVPPDRWDVDYYYDPDPDAPGKISCRYGGFLPDLDKFDAQFFGISPREAKSLDPQQRLLLEVSWEALENAGIAPDSLRGSATGVYVAIGGFDYGWHLALRDKTQVDAYLGTGNAHSVASGRLSYFLGLRGPSLSIETACSSSLVTLHLACQALRRGECSLALVGAVNFLLTPDISINFSKAGMLASDGRCKTFDQSADGYVRGEGCGVIVIKRLSDVRTSERILAIVRGSAVNQDGRSSGLTVPNGLAQEEVIRWALTEAGIEPHEIGYVEAHGTGTSLGDPIEAGALGAVFAPSRPEHLPLWVGSVKTNIGHLETGAGMAGLLKVILSLQEGRIFPSLHFRDPSPHIDWDAWCLRVPVETHPWPDNSKRRIAGISSFGFSGTNAHVVVESAPTTPLESSSDERPVQILTLSASTESALETSKDRVAEHLKSLSPAAVGDFCYTLNSGRARLQKRLAVIGSTPGKLRDELLSANPTPGRSFRANSGDLGEPRIAFLFPGQGSQYRGMGRQLFAGSSVFREALKTCDELFRPHLDLPLLDLLFDASAEADWIRDARYAQPILFSLQYALCQQWKAWGVVPDIVIGHSDGEFAAACTTGVFDLEDAIGLVSLRGRLISKLPFDGSMVAVLTGPEDIARVLNPWPVDISIAAINGPQQVILSGLTRAIDKTVHQLNGHGFRTISLDRSHSLHSPLLDSSLEPFEQACTQVPMNQPGVPLVSNVTGEIAKEEIVLGSYWRRQLREPVRFSKGMESLAKLGCNIFLEIGPRPTLQTLGQACLPNHDFLWLCSLDSDRDDWNQIAAVISQLFVHGVAIDWNGFDHDHPRRVIDAPTYPFERRRYWIDLDTTPPCDNAVRASEQEPVPDDRLNYRSRQVDVASSTRTVETDSEEGELVTNIAKLDDEEIAGLIRKTYEEL